MEAPGLLENRILLLIFVLPPTMTNQLSHAGMTVQLHVAAAAQSEGAQCMTVDFVIVAIAGHGAGNLQMICQCCA